MYRTIREAWGIFSRNWFVRGLDIRPDEFIKLETSGGVLAQPDPRSGNSGESSIPLFVEALKGLSNGISFDAMRRFGPLLAGASRDDLAQVGNALSTIRHAAAVEIRAKLSDLQDQFAGALRSAAKWGASTLPASSQPTTELALEWAKTEGFAAYDELQKDAASLRTGAATAVSKEQAGSQSAVGESADLAVIPRADLTVISPVDILDLPRVLDERATAAATLVNTLGYLPINPVGQLHLERLEMFPAGIEHGELVHSVPLTPQETVNITHREWTVTTTTFENLDQDLSKDFSETGVSEKTDLTQATETEFEAFVGIGYKRVGECQLQWRRFLGHGKYRHRLQEPIGHPADREGQSCTFVGDNSQCLSPH